MTDDELRALIEQAHQLRELTAHPGWAVLQSFSHERMKATKTAVLNGNVADFEKYKQHTGWLRGIHDTLDAAETVEKMADSERTRRARDDREREQDDAA